MPHFSSNEFATRWPNACQRAFDIAADMDVDANGPSHRGDDHVR